MLNQQFPSFPLPYPGQAKQHVLGGNLTCARSLGSEVQDASAELGEDGHSTGGSALEEGHVSGLRLVQWTICTEPQEDAGGAGVPFYDRAGEQQGSQKMLVCEYPPAGAVPGVSNQPLHGALQDGGKQVATSTSASV